MEAAGIHHLVLEMCARDAHAVTPALAEAALRAILIVTKVTWDVPFCVTKTCCGGRALLLLQRAYLSVVYNSGCK
jgi:hypothetical protein